MYGTHEPFKWKDGIHFFHSKWHSRTVQIIILIRSLNFNNTINVIKIFLMIFYFKYFFSELLNNVIRDADCRPHSNILRVNIYLKMKMLIVYAWKSSFLQGATKKDVSMPQFWLLLSNYFGGPNNFSCFQSLRGYHGSLCPLDVDMLLVILIWGHLNW